MRFVLTLRRNIGAVALRPATWNVLLPKSAFVILQFYVVFCLSNAAAAGQTTKGVAPQSGRTVNSSISTSLNPIDFISRDSLVVPLSSSAIQAIWRKYSVAPKGRFESTPEYAARVGAAIPATKYWAVLLPTSKRREIGCGYELDYDADAEQFVLSIRDLMIECAEAGDGSYIGQNGFGVKKRISKRENTRFGITATAKRFSLESVTIHRSPSEASRIEPFLTAVLLFHPKASATGTISIKEVHYQEPELDDPTDRVTTDFTISSDVVILALVDRRTWRLVASRDLTFNGMGEVVVEVAGLPDRVRASCSLVLPKRALPQIGIGFPAKIELETGRHILVCDDVEWNGVNYRAEFPNLGFSVPADGSGVKVIVQYRP